MDAGLNDDLNKMGDALGLDAVQKARILLLSHKAKRDMVHATALTPAAQQTA